MRRLAARLGAAAVARPWGTVFAVLALVALAIPGIQRITVVGDLHRLIPQRSEASTGMALALEGLTRSDAVYGLVELEGDGPAEAPLMVELGGLLAAGLEAQDLIESARFRPSEGIPAVDPLLLFDVADPEAVAALQERLSPEGARERAALIRQILSGPTGRDARDWLLRDPFGLLELLGERVGRGVQRMDTQEQAFVAPDGRALLMVIRPSYTGVGPDFHQPLYEQLTAAVREVLAAHPDGARVRVGFTGAFMHTREIAAATQDDAKLLSSTSIVAVLALYLLFYRSFVSLLLLLGLLPLAATLTLGVGGYALGELNPMAAGFAAVLFGLGIDPAIHLISRYREQRLEHPPPRAAVLTLEGVGPAVAMSGATTAAALITMAVFDPKAMGQMGLLSGVGVLINSALMLTLLPALWMLLGDRLGPDPGVGVGLARGFARFVHRTRGWIVGGAVLAAIGLTIGWNGLSFDSSMDAFQPEGLEPVRVDRALESRFGDERGKLLVLAAGRDRQAVLEQNDRWDAELRALQAEGAIRSWESLAVLRPADKTAHARRKQLRSQLDLPGAAVAMREALVETGFRAEPFAGALDRLEVLGTAREVDASTLREEAEAEDRRRRAEAKASGAQAPPSWTEWFDAKHLAVVEGETRVVTRVFPLPGADPSELAELLRSRAPSAIAGVDTYVTGLPLVEGENADRFAEWLPLLLALAIVALVLVLWTHYRMPRAVIVGIGPLAFALMVFLAVHSAFDIRLTLFALASLPLLIGVGIDDHLFMLDRYLEGGKPGRLDEAMAGAGRAILVTTVTTLAAFGVLSLSRFEALASLGRAVILALALAFFASVVLMPALLSRILPGADSPDAEGPPG